ncbi:unnamed protein product [Phaedon cochleariae]|uniref:Fanconi anemia group M protein n=1 Tax=Phaedon cochleariae TaxID=80249 RepID=A0A9N9SBT0_PHACE|nr:unnamed protein product [Phaedon cochleariae]
MNSQVNQSTQSQFMCLNLSTDLETKGFDLQAGQSWIYPTNYPVRDYQFNIVQKALLENTLVSLPTGLGKTFIAAVVMYNFFRWYPQGKVIFMAPTRPLVKQQVDACYDIMAIPREATAELTGTKVMNTREEVWKEKRVFFITPQILENDLDTFQDLGPRIKCIVFDEAHKARGNHAYCEVIRKLSSSNKYFRVLALSATPGGTINDVLEVVQNLLISHLEVRTEESLDVSPYVFHRNLTTVVVPLGEKLQSVKDEYMKVLEHYTRSLIKFKVIQGNCGSLTKGKIFMTMKNYQQSARGTSGNYGEIMKSLNICVTLYHAYELLVRHGLRSFLTFYEEHINKPLLRGNTSIMAIMKDVEEYLGPAAKLEQLPDGQYPEVSKDVKFGHPKFYKLRDILVEHFKLKGNSSRVIVFFEFRDSVMEAYALLIQSKPILKPRIFLGQGHGITQKLQINVVKAFREGHCNTLLSTSIGEEGLDVGEVDLIVCFDISNKSPIRMVQRMGRTGRKKEGSIVVLVTEGKEQQTLKDCLIHKNNVAVHVLGSRELAKGLKEESPRLVPEGLIPKCEKIFITVKKPILKKNSSLKDMFRSISSSSSEPTFSPDLQIVEIEERIPTSTFLVTKECSMDQDFQISTIFSKRIEKQRSFQETHQVKHSRDTEIFVKLLQIADSKRFNIPMSQLGGTQELQTKNMKQADIRNMFVKSQSSNDFVIPSTQAPKTSLSPGMEENSTFGSRELFNELSNFLSIEMTDLNRGCKLCLGERDCEKYTLIRKPTAKLNWIELDESVFSTVTKNDLKLFQKSMDKVETEFELEDTLDFGIINTPKEPEEVMELEDLIDNSILNGIFNKTCNFEAPKSLDNLMKKFSTSIANADLSQIESQTKSAVVNENIQTENQPPNVEEILAFFLLTSVEDIFENSNDIGSSQCTIIYSPDIFEPSPTLPTTKIATTPPNEVATLSSDEGSPILGTFQVKRKKKNHSQIVARNLMKDRNLIVDSPSDFTMNKTKLSSTPMSASQKVQEKIHHSAKSSISTESDTTALKQAEEQDIPLKSTTDSSFQKTDSISEIEDICDVSFLGLTELAENFENKIVSPQKPLTQKANQAKDTNLSEIIELSDFCDLEDFVDASFVDNPRNGFEKTQETHKTLRPPSPSQVTITQMISLVNKDSDSFELKSSSNVSQEQSELPRKTRTDYIKTSSTDSGCFILNNPVNTSRLNPFLKNNNVKNLPADGKSKVPLANQIIAKNKPLHLFGSRSGSSNVPKDTKADVQLKNKPKGQTPSGPSNSSQKENMDATLDIDDSDLFDFSFNNKRSTGKKTNNVSPAKRNSLNKSGDSPSLVKNVDESIKKLSLNMSIQCVPSDDDFETHPWIKPKAKIVKKTCFGGDKPTGHCSKTVSKPKKKRKRIGRQFVEDEAELSLCDGFNVSEDEDDEENQDCYEPSFVADETHYVDTQMHIRYLQSVRSPVLPSKFRSHRKTVPNIDVYSQEVDRENDTYLDDSFVVHEEIEETIASQAELTELEILEKKLEMRRKKRKKSDGVDNPVKKRRRIVIEESDSD